MKYHGLGQLSACLRVKSQSSTGRTAPGIANHESGDFFLGNMKSQGVLRIKMNMVRVQRSQRHPDDIKTMVEKFARNPHSVTCTGQAPVPRFAAENLQRHIDPAEKHENLAQADSQPSALRKSSPRRPFRPRSTVSTSREIAVVDSSAAKSRHTIARHLGIGCKIQR